MTIRINRKTLVGVKYADGYVEVNPSGNGGVMEILVCFFFFILGMTVMKFLTMWYLKKYYPESDNGCDSCEWYFSGTHHTI